MRKDQDCMEKSIDYFYHEEPEKPTAQDIEIKALGDLFELHRLKYLGNSKKVLGKVEKIKTNKNYPTFLKLYNYLKERSYFEPSVFIEAQLYWAKKQNHKYCSPSWLITENAELRYNDFIKSRMAIQDSSKGEVQDFKKQILAGLKNSILFLKKKQVELGVNSIQEVLSYKKTNALVPEAYIWVMNGGLLQPYMAISKGYKELYNSLDDDIKKDFTDPNDLVTMRQLIILNKELHTFCKSIIPEDCNF